MKILIAPAESKVSGGEYPPINLSEFPVQKEVILAYEEFIKNSSIELLSKWFELKDLNLVKEYKKSILTKPTTKAIQRYSGVAFEAIEYNNLSYSLPNFYGVIKFKNLPVDENIPMPPTEHNNYSRIDKKSYISENILVLISLIYGEPYSMYHEGKGLVNNLIPSKNRKNDFTGLGSSVELGFHIENSALRYLKEGNCSPKALLLGGVRQQRPPPLHQ